MSTDFASTPEHRLTALDALPGDRESQQWHSFYQDRARPCPFFESCPDESLAKWIDEGVIRRGRAVDLGCENGRNAVYLVQRGFWVEGVDYSESAIVWAREQVARAQVAVALHQRSVFDLDLVSGAYDLVYDSGCFHHIAPHRRHLYVELVAQALKPGGWSGLACFKPEGGSGYTDDQVYERRSLGGGLGYTQER